MPRGSGSIVARVLYRIVVHANVLFVDDEWFRKIIRKRMPRKALTWKIAFFDRRLIGRWGFGCVANEIGRAHV